MTISSKELAATLRAELKAHSDPARAIQHKAYLKSELAHLGVDVPTVRKTVNSLSKQSQLPRAALIALVDELWPSEIYELRLAASLWLCRDKAKLTASDAALLQRLIENSHTWALVDLLAVEVVGDLTERYPTMGKTLDRWATHPDFWVRRAAMLALLKPLRRGGGDFERFSRYADSMLSEREFFIRKAIGWILRERTKKRPDEVYDWVLPRAARLSGLTLREASRKLSAAQQARLKSAAGRS